MVVALLTQAAEDLNLEWTASDPVDLSFVVLAANWTGTYVAQVRTIAGPDGLLLGTLVVAAALVGSDTTFNLTMSQPLSSLIPAGTYAWDLQKVGGITRLGGQVFVLPQVSA